MELNLSLPSFSARSYADVEIRPAKAKKWLSELPILNVIDSSHKVFSSLSTLNRMGIDDKDRLVLLELYTDPVHMLSQEMQKSFIGLPLPLSDRNKMSAERNRQFAMEMAYGYKRIILNAFQAEKNKPKEKLMAEMALPIQRAIRYLSEILLRSYQFYATCPQGIWQEIHTLYRYAESLDLIDVAVDDPLNRAVARSSISHVYKQALLVDLSDPFHLPVRIIQMIHQYLDRWASFAQLTEAATVDTGECRFLIDQKSDRASHAFSADVQITAPDQYRLLNTIELARVIHAQLSVLKANQPLDTEGLDVSFFDEGGQELLQRLISSWGLIPRRHFLRSDKQGSKLEVATGVDSINYWLNGGREFTLSTTLVGPMPLRTQIGIGETTSNNKKDDPGMHSLWEFIDESAGGFSLRKEGATSESVRVGDLIAAKLPGQKSGWNIGVIRWLKMPGHYDIEIGVQRLAPGADPVLIKIIHDDGQETDFLSGLLLPTVKALRQPQTMVTHTGTFKPERVLYVDTGLRLLKLIATLPIESSNYFEQFQFKLLDS